MEKAKSIAVMLFMAVCLVCLSLAFFACYGSPETTGGDGDESGQLAEETQDAHVHDIRHVSAKAATCTAEGNEEYWYCSSCGKIFSDEDGENEITAEDIVVAKLAHTLSRTDAVEATCTEDGNTEYWHCSVCDGYFSDESCETQIKASDTVIAMVAHNLTFVEGVAADCLTDGVAEHYVCLSCGKMFLDETCAAELSLEDVFVSGGHSAVYVGAVDATCTADGKKEHWLCTVCGTMFSDETLGTVVSEGDVAVEATGHSLIVLEETDSTCTTQGNVVCWRCTSCGAYYSDENAAQEISEDDVLKPLADHSGVCAADNSGYHSVTCSVCGTLMSSETHTFDENYVCSVCGYADLLKDGTYGLVYELVSESGTEYEVTGFESGASASLLVVAPVYNGRPVVQVASRAFQGNTTITDVVLQENLAVVGSYAFQKCTNLERVTMSEVVTVDSRAFDGDESLETIEFGTKIETLGSYSLQECSSVKYLTFGETLRTVGLKAFCDCSSLVSVTFSEGLESIGFTAFKNCYKLSYIIIPSTVTFIDDAAFENLDIPVYVCAEAPVSGWDGTWDGESNVTAYYYSESIPAEEGNFWHYADDGVTPVAWTAD